MPKHSSFEFSYSKIVGLGLYLYFQLPSRCQFFDRQVSVSRLICATCRRFGKTINDAPTNVSDAAVPFVSYLDRFGFFFNFFVGGE